MNLSKKLILFLAFQAFLFTLAITSFVYYYIYPTYANLEINMAQQSLKQITLNLKNDAQQFQQFGTGWSIWDEMASYLQTNDKEFAKTYLTAHALEASNFALIAIYYPNGKMMTYSRNTDADSALLIPKFMKSMYTLSAPLIKIDNNVPYEQQGHYGYSLIGNKVLMISINPIYASDPSGAPNGYIMFGRVLDKKIWKKIHEDTGTHFTLSSFKSAPSTIQHQLKNKAKTVITQQTENLLTTYALLSDFSNTSNILITLNTHRNLFQKAQENVKNFLLLGIIAGIMFVLGALLFMNFVILKPIHTLQNQMSWILRNKKFRPIHQFSKTNDEFSDLTKHFNSLIQHVINQNKALEDLSLTDPLTLLQNRRSLDQFITTLGALVQREEKNISIIMIDIDHFKLYNDTYGHVQGDEIIKKIARAIVHNASRLSDFVARYGGEEFIVIFPDTSFQAAKAIAQSICKEIENYKIPHKTSPTSTNITVSIGLSSALVGNKDQILKLLKDADDALYHAKSDGRNKVYSLIENNNDSK